MMVLGILNGGFGLKLANNTKGGVVAYGVVSGVVGGGCLLGVIGLWWNGKSKKSKLTEGEVESNSEAKN